MNAVIEQPLTAPEPKRQKSAYERLKRRHKRFVDQVVLGITGSEAIRSVGCKSQYANSIAARWLQRPYIKAAIEERETQLAYDVGVRAHIVLGQMFAIATSDPRKIVDETGKPLALHELDPQTAAAIAGVEIEETRRPGKDDEPPEQTFKYKYKFWDKPKANDRLGQYVKLWDGSRTNVAVDARSVTVNAGDGAVAAGALQAVLHFGQQLAEGRPAIGAAASGTNGFVLPAEVSAESEGFGAPMDMGTSSGSSEEP